VKDLGLTYEPGSSSETIIAHCPNVGPLPVTMPTWSVAYLGVHMDDLASGDPSAALPPMPDVGSLLGSGSGIPGMPPLPGSQGPSSSSSEAGSGPKFRAAQWQVLGGDLYAEKEWDASASFADTGGTGSMADQGSFRLFHRPQ
jgi:hypothetical protein